MKIFGSPIVLVLAILFIAMAIFMRCNDEPYPIEDPPARDNSGVAE